MEIAMSDPIPLTFVFSDEDYRLLDEMRAEGAFKDEAELVSRALRIIGVLQKQSDEGYTEVIVRNPRTMQQRRIKVSPTKY